MTTAVLSCLRWCVSLASKFSRVVFWHTASIVLLTLTSQLSALLASLLPLKVVILLGSETMPHYFPEVLRSYGRDSLIVSLSVATGLFFLVHLWADRLISCVTRRATQRLLLHGKKVVLFENQDGIAASAYQKFSRMLAGGIFCLLSLVFISLVYPDFSGVILIYLVFAILFIESLNAIVSGFRDHLDRQLSQVVTMISSLGFFVLFAYLVADFILWQPPSILIAIISFLLVRQFLNRLSGVVKDIASLYSQRVKVDALFFHEKVFMPSESQEDKTYWPLLTPERRAVWINSIFRQFIDGWGAASDIRWHSSSHPGLAVLIVQGVADSERFIVKLYDGKKSSQALHESTLLSEVSGDISAPKFCAVTKFDNQVCQLYEFPDMRRHKFPGREPPSLRTLRLKLLEVEPPLGLVHRYRRSKAFLWQRLSEFELKRLNVAAVSEEQSFQVERLLVYLPRLKSLLSALPLTFVNPDVRPVNIFSEKNVDECFFVNWSRWILEPIGFGFGMSKGDINALETALSEAAAVRPVLTGLDENAVKLAALSSALEEYCKRQQLEKGLEIVDKILVCLENLGQDALHSASSHSGAQHSVS